MDETSSFKVLYGETALFKIALSMYSYLKLSDFNDNEQSEQSSSETSFQIILSLRIYDCDLLLTLLKRKGPKKS